MTSQENFLEAGRLHCCLNALAYDNAFADFINIGFPRMYTIFREFALLAGSPKIFSDSVCIL
jgi:hypothetical protein